MSARVSIQSQRWILVLALFATIAALQPGRAHACKCAAPLSVPAALSAAAVVFEGRVISNGGDTGEEGSAYQVDLAVLQIGKGLAADTKRVTLTAWRGGCELVFAVNRKYVVYASQPSPGVLTTNVCSRTRESVNAAEDLAAFRSAASPKLNSPSTDANKQGKGGCSVAPFVPSAPGGLLVAALAFLALQRPRTRAQRLDGPRRTYTLGNA